MAGTVTLSGVVSGLDTDSIIAGLVNASSTSLNASKTRATTLRSAVTTLSDVGTKLSALQTAVAALASADAAAGLKATSSSSAITATAGSTALPGSFDVTVSSIAAEQRTYSASFASATTALGQTGSFNITVGTGVPTTIQVEASDTLTTIAAKINSAGLRVSASVFQEGSTARLQIRGLDTGTANGLTFAETGTALDLNGDGSVPTGGKTIAATDAVLLVDGYQVTRSTNKITDVIAGVTLSLSAKTTSAQTITVAEDSSSVQSKIEAIVSAFNSTTSAIHFAAGFGTIKASNSILAGDSSLRTVANRMSSVLGESYTAGSYKLLAEIGLTVARDGSLTLDSAKLATAISKDGVGAANLLLNRMSAFKTSLTEMTDKSTGILAVRQSTLTEQATKLDTWAAKEQERLDRYADRLRTQFAAMETAMAQSQALISQLSAISS